LNLRLRCTPDLTHDTQSVGLLIGRDPINSCQKTDNGIYGRTHYGE
jgi:hypothetical protein